MKGKTWACSQNIFLKKPSAAAQANVAHPPHHNQVWEHETPIFQAKWDFWGFSACTRRWWGWDTQTGPWIHGVVLEVLGPTGEGLLLCPRHTDGWLLLPKMGRKAFLSSKVFFNGPQGGVEICSPSEKGYALTKFVYLTVFDLIMFDNILVITHLNPNVLYPNRFKEKKSIKK